SAYLERLNSPTPWTRQATSAFRNTLRGLCRVVFSDGCGDGGFMLTLRFDALPEPAAALERHLVTTALPPLAEIKGVTGVHLCIADQSASNIDTTERRNKQVDVLTGSSSSRGLARTPSRRPATCCWPASRKGTAPSGLLSGASTPSRFAV